jgi:hypothetical protein
MTLDAYRFSAEGRAGINRAVIEGEEGADGPLTGRVRAEVCVAD